MESVVRHSKEVLYITQTIDVLLSDDAAGVSK